MSRAAVWHVGKWLPSGGEVAQVASAAQAEGGCCWVGKCLPTFTASFPLTLLVESQLERLQMLIPWPRDIAAIESASSGQVHRLQSCDNGVLDGWNLEDQS